jgi:hypothetical protein
MFQVEVLILIKQAHAQARQHNPTAFHSHNIPTVVISTFSFPSPSPSTPLTQFYIFGSMSLLPRLIPYV